MLGDKTQFFNRLENSNCTVKTNAFGQTIKNPYLAQYKIFQERLKNPKTKTMSMIIRKRKNQENIGKQNLLNQMRLFQQQECLKQAKKLINKEQSKFTVFSNNTIDYDVNQHSKQSQVLMKFKQKLKELKTIKDELKGYQKERVLPFNVSQFVKYPRIDIYSSSGSQRRKLNQIKPNTADINGQQKQRMRIRSHQSSNNNVAESKNKLPLTFVAYKKNKSFAERFTKDKK